MVRDVVEQEIKAIATVSAPKTSRTLFRRRPNLTMTGPENRDLTFMLPEVIDWSYSCFLFAVKAFGVFCGREKHLH